MSAFACSVGGLGLLYQTSGVSRSVRISSDFGGYRDVRGKNN